MKEKYFCCIAATHGAAAYPATREMWEAQRNSPLIQELAEKINRATSDQEVRGLKSQLMVWTPRCARFRDNRRRQENAELGLSRLMLDIDQKGQTDAVMKLLTADGHIGPLEVLLIEESIRHGTHVMVRLPEGMAPNEVQSLFAELTGLKVDPAVKNVAGCIYQVPAGFTRFVAEGLFEAEGEGVDPKTDEGVAKTMGVDPKAAEGVAQTMVVDPKAAEGVAQTRDNMTADHKATEDDENDAESWVPPTGYNGVEYGVYVLKYLQLFNDGKEPVEGSRNALTFELAKTLAPICEYNQAVLEFAIPRYDGFGESEWRQTIANALKEPRRGFGYRLKQVMDAVKQDRKLAAISLVKPSDVSSEQDHTRPAERPEKLPKLLTLLTSCTPAVYVDTVCEAVWPSLCLHLHGARFRYIDGTERECTISSPLIGRMSSGKGCINKPIEYINADIAASDEVNRQREADWRAQNRKKGSNKDKNPRPADLLVRLLNSDLTNAAFVQRLMDADNNGGYFTYTKVDEIELLNQLRNSTGKSSVSQLTRLAFDSLTSTFGQERVGLDSVVGTCHVRWLWNASCTPKVAMKFFSGDWLTTGSLSRLNVNAILLPVDHHEIPVFGDYGEDFADQLRPYITNLTAASGLIDCPQADRLAHKLVQEYEKKADCCDSEALRQLSYRAIAITWMKACILYVAHGYKWSRTYEPYLRWALERDMWLKMYYFGNALETELGEEKPHNGNPNNLLSLMPDEFSQEEFRTMYARVGRSRDPLQLLRQWVCRGYVAFDEVTGRYLKGSLRSR